MVVSYLVFNWKDVPDSFLGLRRKMSNWDIKFLLKRVCRISKSIIRHACVVWPGYI